MIGKITSRSASGIPKRSSIRSTNASSWGERSSSETTIPAISRQTFRRIFSSIVRSFRELVGSKPEGAGRDRKKCAIVWRMVPRQPSGQKLALVMVGLPARGKTFVARKLQRYLSWLGHRTLWVNVGDYRRARAGAKQPAEYFAPDNLGTRGERIAFAMAALDDLLDWFASGGEVGIYDAANTERSRRDVIRERCAAAGVKVLFVESICDDSGIIDANVRRNKLNLPDYAGMSAADSFRDFQSRIFQYARTYEPVADAEGSYAKIVDAGQKVILNRIDGYFLARLVFFLMHIHPTHRPIDRK